LWIPLKEGIGGENRTKYRVKIRVILWIILLNLENIPIEDPHLQTCNHPIYHYTKIQDTPRRTSNRSTSCAKEYVLPILKEHMGRLGGGSTHLLIYFIYNKR
jgi:hypothetical protein